MPFFLANSDNPFFKMAGEYETLAAAREEAESKEPGEYIIVKTVAEVKTEEVVTRKVNYMPHDRRERLPRGAQAAPKGVTKPKTGE